MIFPTRPIATDRLADQNAGRRMKQINRRDIGQLYHPRIRQRQDAVGGALNDGQEVLALAVKRRRARLYFHFKALLLPFQRGVTLLKLSGHIIESFAKFGDFIASLDLDPAGEIAPGDGLCFFAEQEQRTQQMTRQQGPGQGRYRQAHRQGAVEQIKIEYGGEKLLLGKCQNNCPLHRLGC
ncbi:MAG: hypothetical protein A3G18_03490 [Rhodospirillales bacterium RIFCSPLOWO2_12_FULL_58_28]|nr:MAG: hypothetical protein A3G18_03490 [Rhodospirillales bacterium RIFCSPLOWO2_12_FULL_58_28]